jgi:hypothetical protein
VYLDIARKESSGPLAHLPMTFGAPIEAPSVPIDTGHGVGTASVGFAHDQIQEFSGRHGVYRIYGGNQGASVTCYCGEARCSTGAVQQSALQVTVSEHEHRFVFLEGARTDEVVTDVVRVRR